MEEAGVRLVAEGASIFNRQMQDAASAVNNFGDRAAKAATGGIQGMSSATVALGVALGNLAVQGLNAAAAALSGFFASGLELSNNIERGRGVISAFTGDLAEADAIIAGLQERAKTTPFTFNDLLGGAVGLLPVLQQVGGNLDETLRTAEILAALNPLEGIEGASFALAEALSGDYQSLAERFRIPRSVINALKKEGLGGLELVNRALEDAGINYDIVSNLATTFEGRLSTLSDVSQEFAKNILEPAKSRFNEFLGELLPLMEANSGTLDAFSKTIGDGLVWALQLGRDAVVTFAQAVSGDWVDSDIIHPFHRVVGVIGQVARAFGEDGLQGAIRVVQPYVQEAFTQLSDYVQGQLPVWEAELRKWGDAAWQWILNATEPARTELSNYVAQLPQYIVDHLPDWANSFLQWGIAAAQWISDSTPGWIIKAGEWMASVSSWVITTGLPRFLGEMKKLEKAAWQWIVDASTQVGPKFGEFLIATTKALKDVEIAAKNAAWNIGAAIIEAIISSLNALAFQVGNALSDLISKEVQRGIEMALKDMGIIREIEGNSKGVGQGTTTAPPASTPSGSPNTTNKTNISVQVVVPPNTSPATASRIVSDGVLAAQRSRGMA